MRELKRVKRQKVWTGLPTTAISAFAVTLLLAGSVQARISQNLSGRLRVGFFQSETDVQKRENLDQEYVLGWQQQFSKNLLGRTSLRYYNVGVTQSDGPNNWRSELQPSVEAYWRQRAFSVTGLGQYQETKSNDRSIELVTQIASVTIKSQVPNYPYMKANLGYEKRYNQVDRSDRDTRDQILELGTGYNSLRSSVQYSFKRRVTDDWSRELRSSTTHHSLRLQQSLNWIGGSVRSSISYRGDYRVQTDENLTGGSIPREIPIFAGLAARDESPETGGLDTVLALADGDVTSETVPPINIGDGNTGWNIGADLGSARDVDMLYIYTDVPSDNSVAWTVFTSEDAVFWQSQGRAQSVFSPGFSRYEISFDKTTTRYIKVVNSGFNLSDSVFVTEMQAFVHVNQTSKLSLDNFFHEIDLTNTVHLSSNLSSNVNVTLRDEPGNAQDPGRREAYFNSSIRHKISDNLHQTIQGELALLDIKNTMIEVNRSTSGGYSLEYLPIRTLDLTASAYARANYISSFRSEEFYNAFVRAGADLFPQLKLNQEVGLNRTRLNQVARQLDSWSYRAYLIGSLTQWLEGQASYRYRETTENEVGLIVRKEYLLGFTYMISENMQLRGNLNSIEDALVRSLTQNFIFTWRMTPKVSTSASAYLLSFDAGSRTERYGAQIDYSLTRRTTLTGTVQENDLTGTGGVSTMSFRIGIRTGF